MKYTREVKAEVEGFPSIGFGTPLFASNPANFIRYLLENDVWGLGLSDIDTDSFDIAEGQMLNLKMEGVITGDGTVASYNGKNEIPRNLPPERCDTALKSREIKQFT